MLLTRWPLARPESRPGDLLPAVVHTPAVSGAGVALERHVVAAFAARGDMVADGPGPVLPQETVSVGFALGLGPLWGAHINPFRHKTGNYLEHPFIERSP